MDFTTMIIGTIVLVCLFSGLAVLRKMAEKEEQERQKLEEAKMKQAEEEAARIETERIKREEATYAVSLVSDKINELLEKIKTNSIELGECQEIYSEIRELRNKAYEKHEEAGISTMRDYPNWNNIRKDIIAIVELERKVVDRKTIMDSINNLSRSIDEHNRTNEETVAELCNIAKDMYKKFYNVKKKEHPGMRYCNRLEIDNCKSMSLSDAFLAYEMEVKCELKCNYNTREKSLTYYSQYPYFKYLLAEYSRLSENIVTSYDKLLNELMNQASPFTKYLYAEDLYKEGFHKQAFLYYSEVYEANDLIKKDYPNLYIVIISMTELHLGLCYENKYGCQVRDYEKAFSFYTESAQKGNPEAIFRIGNLYEHGNGVKTNYQKAGDCYYKLVLDGKHEYNKYLDNLYTSHRWDKSKYDFNSVLSNSQDDDYRVGKRIAEFFAAKKEQYNEEILSANAINAIVTVNDVAEQLCKDMIDHYCRGSYNLSFFEVINKLNDMGIFDDEVASSMHFIRKLRNRILHNSLGEAITLEEIENVKNNAEIIFDYIDTLS